MGSHTLERFRDREDVQAACNDHKAPLAVDAGLQPVACHELPWPVVVRGPAPRPGQAGQIMDNTVLIDGGVELAGGDGLVAAAEALLAQLDAAGVRMGRFVVGVPDRR